jgi:hypothetical protein
MTDCRLSRRDPAARALNDRVSGMKDSVLPVERFQSPGILKLQPELIRELAQKAFERIEVWPLKVRVVMKDGSRFEIERCKIHNSRVLPHWRARIRGTEIGRETRVDVVYFYKSCRQYLRCGKLPVKVVYQGRGLRVMTMGVNDIYQKTHVRPHQFPPGWESAEYSRMEVGAGGGGEQVEIQLNLG